jgi:hypothetical protein
MQTAHILGAACLFILAPALASPTARADDPWEEAREDYEDWLEDRQEAYEDWLEERRARFEDWYDRAPRRRFYYRDPPRPYVYREPPLYFWAPPYDDRGHHPGAPGSLHINPHRGLDLVLPRGRFRLFLRW